MADFFAMLLQVDQYLGVWAIRYGGWVYVVLFLVIFSETGLVVLPFLPGDSLLFIAGAFAAAGVLDPWLLSGLLMMAAVAGNTLNYMVGRWVGPRVLKRDYRFLNRQALVATHLFYERHGGKTIVISRFLPIVRTFAPFVAGVAGMGVARFQLFNGSGAVLWVGGLVALGYFFGHVPIIRDHLSVIVLLGLAAVIVPLLAALWLRWRRRRVKDT